MVALFRSDNTEDSRTVFVGHFFLLEMPGQRERETDRLVSNLEMREERVEELDRLVRGVQGCS